MHYLWSNTTILQRIRKVCSGMLVVAILFGDVSLVFAQTFSAPREISYQAKLATSGNVAVPDGLYHVTFRLYTVPTGGAALWTEVRTGANRVTVTNGLFSVMLGSVTSLAGVDFNQPLYLGVEIGGSAGAAVWDGEMTPRKSLGAVPSALVADTLDGLDSAAFLRATATTSYIPEGSNLYFTSSRATTAVAQLLAGTTTDAIDEGTTNWYFTQNRFAAALAGTTTSALAEGTNLYFTNGRVQTYLSGLDKGYFFSTTSADAWKGSTNFFSTTSSDSWLTTKSTTNVAEGTNLYWTSLRATTSFAQLLAATNTSALAEGTNLYWTTLRGAALLAGTTTDAIAEGATNRYYTTLRFAASLAATTTDALAEGSTNRYFSNALVDTWLGTKSLGVFFSTTSADAWDATKNRWGTTSADFWLTTKSLTAASSTLLTDNNTFSGATQVNKLTFTNATGTNATTTSFFTTLLSLGTGTTTAGNGISLTNGCYALSGTCLTSTNIPEGTNLYFTNGRVQTYLDTMDKGYFFSSTSADAWDLTKNRWSTTSSDYWLTTKSLTAASSTLLGDQNTWSGLNSFAQLTVGNATATNSFTNSLTALFGSFGTFSATNTQATSTIAGGFDVGSGGLTYDLSTGITSIANLELGSSAFAPDSGLVTWTDMGVTAASPIGTQNAYTAAFDGNALFTLSSISDGADGLSAATVGIGTTTPLARFAITGFAGQTFPLFQIASSTDAPYLTLTADGKLGLGTTTPTDLLTVAGNTTVTGTITGGQYSLH